MSFFIIKFKLIQLIVDATNYKGRQMYGDGESGDDMDDDEAGGRGRWRRARSRKINTPIYVRPIRVRPIRGTQTLPHSHAAAA